jgi:phospholipid/cholesterol/gamma-HCH transport system substrate-binding protein
MRRMTAPIRRGGRAVVLLLATAILAAAGAGIAAAATHGGDSAPTKLTAYFTKTIGLYNGNDVDVLGIKVGKIDSLKVQGTRVKVTMTLNGKTKLPAGVQAVVVPPSLVSDRYIQLQPAYTSGRELANDATLGLNRTAVPLEYDQVFGNLNQLTTALGPKGANSKGALSRLVDVGSKNLNGNGAQLKSTLQEFSQAVSTLSGSRGNLFTTVRALQQFTTTLADHDGGVRKLNANLDRVGTQLAGERTDLGAALSSLSNALKLVDTFVAQNKNGITTDVKGLTSVSNVLVKEKEAITQVIDDAPEAVTNLSLAGDTAVANQESVNGTSVVTLDTKVNPLVPLTSTGASSAFCQLLSSLSLSAICDALPNLSTGDLSTLTNLLGAGTIGTILGDVTSGLSSLTGGSGNGLLGSNTATASGSPSPSASGGSG